ncbi:conserved hypothetical protein [Pediculus humanus corporis]|uniref:DUF4789 domain-containing protein n=1 Tax=Pediculus humanus subsp. corporis TaxID=121224 RepID=E0VBA6_PEDHC|nr:uncharacterized protein Phum_PHUM055780 [Pediculus humanus corporis]EEB10661.1 conserved hypothetical protein [Pediculus humanus corporis]
MKGVIIFGFIQLLTLHAAILPPPWADPDRNPCASQPGGWLLIYWPPDKKCYRIFQRGYPCPETMELNPMQDHFNRTVADCRCPPRTAQILNSDKCYEINTKGPCEDGEYFAPLRQSINGRERIGRCIKAKQCKPEEVFWAATGQCFLKYTKGPCPDGELITLNKETQLGECQCSKNGPLSKFYWNPTKTCHEYFTKGPCLEKGTLFLPGSTCGCHNSLPNYDFNTHQCYEIGTMGPCKSGQLFQVEPPKLKGSCICKPEHVPWDDGQCYRLYTRGPCLKGEILFPNKTCIENPCPKGKLYFPQDGSCHRVGVRGPCARGQLVLFEPSVRSSVEGISYRGMCGCSGPTKCKIQEEDDDENAYKIRICEKNENSKDDNCYSLYSQGPCSQGEWLLPVRQGRTDKQYHRFDESTKLKARCECKPGFSKSSNGNGCHLPLVTLAKFLNGEDLFS